MKNKRVFLNALYILCALTTLSQPEISLPHNLDNPEYEYSGLGIWRSKILLLPQYPSKYIYGLDSSEVKRIADKGKGSIINYHTWQVKNLFELIKGIKGYQGFESITIVDDQFFCSVETDSSNDECYLVKGIISDSLIVFEPKALCPLKKFKKLKNKQYSPIKEAGYESLAYLKDQNKLLAIFEYNKFPSTSNALLVSLDFKSVTPIGLQSIDFRLTDICVAGNNKLYAINHYYFKEYCEYEPNEKIEKTKGILSDWSKDSFTRIVNLEIRDGMIKSTPVRTISFNSDNWEGILAFPGGILMITDKYPESKLVYYKL